MAEKELTTFVVDVSSTMTSNDIDIAKRYINDVVAAKCVKGRKTDYVGVISVGLSITDNPYSEKAFQNIQVVEDRVAPKYADLVKINEALRINTDPVDTQDELVGDIFEGLILAVSLMKDTVKLKFVRNVVIFTNGESPVHLFNSKLAEATKDRILKLGINVLFVGTNIDRNEIRELWRTKIEEIGGRFITGEDAILSMLYNPPIKPVRPMKAYKGPLRFGADPKSEENDVFSLQFNVEVYPAVKIETIPSSHLYWNSNTKDDENPGKIIYEREYYIKKRKLNNAADSKGKQDDSIGERKVELDDEKFEEQVIEPSTKVKGFKFSNYDLVALDDTISEAVVLKTFLGMDIMGFYNKDEFPYGYLSESSFYIVPGNGTSQRDIVGFNALCVSLEQLNSIAMVRYVPKDNSEVSVCVMFPTRMKYKSEYVNVFIMTRIPFKEDENIGRFPNLIETKVKSNKEDKEEKETGEDEEAVDEKEEGENDGIVSNLKYPKPDINNIMESFILSKDIDIEDDKYINSNKAVATALKGSSLPQPPAMGWLDQFSFLEPSPGIHKFNRNFRKIISASHSSGNLNSVDVSQLPDDLLLIGQSRKKTNLFNLQNVFELNNSKNKDYLDELNKESIPIARQIVDKLDIRYISKAEAEQRKKNAQGPSLKELFNYTRDQDDEYDEMPDIDQLLGES